jgi:phenylacetate-CoA ligase
MIGLHTKLLLYSPFEIRRLRKNRRCKKDDLRNLQNNKLKALVNHSYKNVPRYRLLFKKANLSPDDIKTIDDLPKIPISRKEDLVNVSLKDNVASNVDLSNCVLRRTSGSTGIPLSIYWDKKARLKSNLMQKEWQLDCGDKITNKQVVIGVAWVYIHPSQKIGIFRTKRISAFEDPKTQIEQIKEYNPKTMIAYPSSARVLSKIIKKEDSDQINIERIFTGGEMLNSYTRKLVKEKFEADIFDSYGATEVGGISQECVKHTGYHVREDMIIAEIIQEDEILSSGEEGEITVTNLENYAMPILRYNLMDLGFLVEDTCSCGSYFSLMKITQGRKSDVIKLSNGKLVPAIEVYGGLDYIIDLKQFQITQHKIDYFTVKIVENSQLKNSVKEEVQRIFKG